MKAFPSVPSIEDAPEALLERGHLWIQEYVEGGPLRFRLESSSVITFTDRRRSFDPDDVPPRYRHAVDHVRRRLDRTALREAVEDVESIVFFAVATHRHTIDYEWDRMPSVLGFDIWSQEEDRFLPPDVVERSYQALGLDPVNTFQKEVRASDFQPDVSAIPQSAWYDGPAAGIVVRNKTGQRAKLSNPAIEDVAVEPISGSGTEVADRFATADRFESAEARLDRRGDAVTVDALLEAVLDSIARSQHHRLFHPAADIDWESFRSAVARRTQQYLSDRS